MPVNFGAQQRSSEDSVSPTHRRRRSNYLIIKIDDTQLPQLQPNPRVSPSPEGGWRKDIQLWGWFCFCVPLLCGLKARL